MSLNALTVPEPTTEQIAAARADAQRMLLTGGHVAPTTVRVLLAALCAADEAADEYGSLLTRQGDLLRRTVNALRGDPPPLTTWSHHDVPELAAEMRSRAGRAEGRVAMAEGLAAVWERVDPDAAMPRHLAAMTLRDAL